MLFFPALLKNIGNFNDIHFPIKQDKLKIDALFRLLIVYTNTKKTHTHRCEISTFNVPLRI